MSNQPDNDAPRRKKARRLCKVLLAATVVGLLGAMGMAGLSKIRDATDLAH
jgi:hypothetical protein